MRRTITIASCVAILCVAAILVWVYVKRTEEGGASVREGTSHDQASNESSGSTEKRATSPSVFTLPVQVAFLGNDEFSPSYVDEGSKTLYRWKDVILRPEQLLGTPYARVPSGISPLNAKNFSVVPVEAPVTYWETNEGFRPGYLDRTIWVFYAWKGVVLSKQELLDKRKDGQSAIVKPAFASQVINVIEIEMPAYLKEQPRLWKKS